MPELPEVEVTKKALSFALRDTSIIGVNVRNKKLRWPIEENKIKNLYVKEILLFSEKESKKLKSWKF